MINIQVKAPYTSIYRSGLRVTYGKTLNVSPQDPRVMLWLENGLVEIVEPPKPAKADESQKPSRKPSRRERE